MNLTSYEIKSAKILVTKPYSYTGVQSNNQELLVTRMLVLCAAGDCPAGVASVAAPRFLVPCAVDDCLRRSLASVAAPRLLVPCAADECPNSIAFFFLLYFFYPDSCDMRASYSSSCDFCGLRCSRTNASYLFD